ncbi:MAG TPA: hypothetical protein VGN72_11965 [Tepidisphaeraceae bacterium]|jgi:hypothetical protein|nr:hypothetical protein [Tepidisphaeraceae bacterium]
MASGDAVKERRPLRRVGPALRDAFSAFCRQIDSTSPSTAVTTNTGALPGGRTCLRRGWGTFRPSAMRVSESTAGSPPSCLANILARRSIARRMTFFALTVPRVRVLISLARAYAASTARCNCSNCSMNSTSTPSVPARAASPSANRLPHPTMSASRSGKKSYRTAHLPLPIFLPASACAQPEHRQTHTAMPKSSTISPRIITTIPSRPIKAAFFLAIMR